MALSGKNILCKLGKKQEIAIDQIQLQPAKIYIMTAASGAGKSTVLAMIGGGLKTEFFDNGYLRWTDEGIDATPLENREYFAPSLTSILPQNAVLIPFLSIRENIQLALTLLRRTDKALLNEMVEFFAISQLLNRYPKQISLGQRQRVALCQTLISKPKIALLDEPISALDDENARLIESFIHKFSKKYRTVFLIAHHGHNYFQSNVEPIHHRIRSEAEVNRSCFYSPKLSGEHDE